MRKNVITTTVAEKLKILMLDDEKFLLFVYQNKFEKAGFDVLAFHTADSALSVIRSGYVPHIILTDITIPDSKSGYEFLEILQRERLCRHTLKIALTNEGQDAEIARMGELGADGHILKAKYTPSELVTEVTTMFEVYRSKRR